MAGPFTIFGGTGFLGRRIVETLLDEGQSVRIACRAPDRLPDLLRSDRVEPVRADLLEPATLAAALAGADGVVNATSLYVESDGLTFDAVHVEGAARLARAARDAGVRRFVQLSGIGADPDARDPYIRARGQGEAAVQSMLPEAVIVRPSAMFGPDDALLSAVLRTARMLPLFPLFGAGDTQIQPVHVNDVARAIVRVLRLDAPQPCYEFGGPEVYTYRALVREVAIAAGVKIHPVPIPFAAWRLLAAVAEVLPGAPLTRSQVALLEADNVAAADLPGLPALGVAPRNIIDFVRET